MAGASWYFPLRKQGFSPKIDLVMLYLTELRRASVSRKSYLGTTDAENKKNDLPHWINLENNVKFLEVREKGNERKK